MRRRQHKSLDRNPGALISTVERAVKDHFDLIELIEAWRRGEGKFDSLPNGCSRILLHIRNRSDGRDAYTQRQGVGSITVDQHQLQRDCSRVGIRIYDVDVDPAAVARANRLE